MGILKLFSVSILFLLVVLPIQLVGDEAYAGCCTCDMGCVAGCRCPGTYPCAACVVGNPEAVQTNSDVSDGTPSQIAVQKTVSLISMNSDTIDQLIRPLRRSCAKNSSRLKITDGNNALTFDDIFLKG